MFSIQKSCEIGSGHGNVSSSGKFGGDLGQALVGCTGKDKMASFNARAEMVGILTRASLQSHVEKEWLCSCQPGMFSNSPF